MHVYMRYHYVNECDLKLNNYFHTKFIILIFFKP